ncbi:MAG: zinc ribbon domain-containing protein [Candidatus Hydrogenedentes bacterium]|nr:zinc ribbon domain-containing protein [Candidatus Hydrogenedentota bacterium]
MPLFEYYCEDCDSQSEILVRGKARPACPKCGSKHLVKMLSTFAPMTGSSARPQPPVGCGVSNCCRLQEGGCPHN